MPREGEFDDPAADAAHVTTVLGPLCPDARGMGSGNPVLGVDVWTMLYLLSSPTPPVHSPLPCIVCGGGGGCHFPFCALLRQLDIELLLRVAGWTRWFIRMLNKHASPQAVPGSFYGSRGLVSLECRIGCVKDVPMLAYSATACVHVCSATACVHVWYIVQLQECLCGRSYTCMQSCMTNYAMICMHMWHIMQPYACLCGRLSTACMPM